MPYQHRYFYHIVHAATVIQCQEDHLSREGSSKKETTHIVLPSLLFVEFTDFLMMRPEFWYHVIAVDSPSIVNKEEESRL